MCVWQCLFVIGDVLVKRPRSQLLFKAQPIRINTSIKVFQPNLFFKLMCIYRYYYPTCHYWMDNKCFYNVDWRLGPKPHTKRIIFYYYYYYFPVQQFYPDNKNKREGERDLVFLSLWPIQNVFENFSFIYQSTSWVEEIDWSQRTVWAQQSRHVTRRRLPFLLFRMRLCEQSLISTLTGEPTQDRLWKRNKKKGTWRPIESPPLLFFTFAMRSCVCGGGFRTWTK